MNLHWVLAYFYVFDVSFVLALICTPILRRLAYDWGWVDQPDQERKIHTRPMPLLGGLAVFVAFTLNILANYFIALPLLARLPVSSGVLAELQVHAAGAFSVMGRLLVVLLGGALMVVLGMVDDKLELRARVKLLAQLLIALIVAAAGVRVTLFLPSTVLSYIVTVLWIVTITNALNFLDNMDGLCAGVGLVCAGLFAFIAGIQQQSFVCVLALALCGALLGFLPYNFKPATIFLGDAGSHFIGYMLAVLPILTTFYTPAGAPTHLPVLIPLLVLAVPLFDMGLVTWMRWRRGQAVHVGDTTHISHRLVRLGLPESWAVTLIYLITLTLGLGATILLWSEMTAALIVIVQSICILAIVTVLEQLGGQR